MKDGKFNYGHRVYRHARAQAFERSDGVCQLCGHHAAVEAHHWRREYVSECETVADDLVGLCNLCHFVATTMRRFYRAGGSPFVFNRAIERAVKRAWSSTEAPSADDLPTVEPNRARLPDSARVKSAAVEPPAEQPAATMRESARQRSGPVEAVETQVVTKLPAAWR